MAHLDAVRQAQGLPPLPFGGEAKYAIRLPANDNLERKVAPLLTRPVGRPSYKPVVHYKSFLYQAASWTRARTRR